MKATWDRLEKNWMQFSVEVEADRFQRAIEDTYRRLVRRARIPGFRPGKAPRFIFERYYGKENLLAEAAQALVPEAYAEAVDQGGVEPIDEPEIDVDTLEEGKPLTFRGKVQVKPEVKLGRLSGFDIEEPKVEVTEEDVDRQLQQLRERVAQIVPDEGGEVRAGSYAVVDIEGTVDGQPLPEGKQEGRTLEIGTGRLLPDFENQLLGARVGETRTVELTYPDDHPDERLRGKKASYTVTVRDLKVKELPELNDDFAKQVGPFETLQELRSDVENRLRDSARAQAERDFRNKVVEAVVAEAEVEVPEVLVHRRLHELLDDFVRSLAAQGVTVQAYLQATGQDERALHDQFEEPARSLTKTDLVLEAVAAREGLQVSEAEIDAQLDALAGLYQGRQNSLASLRRSREYRARVRESLLKQKAIDHLVKLNRPPAAEKAPVGAGAAGGEGPAPAGSPPGETSRQEPES
ncbi:trigger factor [Caldinitratiruptor microaerophilus]|uniref:Trigger factor n=1 Tax=Caldinitratiruptor microaerophilus TaxID=671077 RepID=A0AA35CPL9_9FIRM|nr:trigger factor [Caldinitratiruptor microaerophilus]BDG61526.1 trigger factor [Caldinitratiruptor microaerophilus]